MEQRNTSRILALTRHSRRTLHIDLHHPSNHVPNMDWLLRGDARPEWERSGRTGLDGASRGPCHQAGLRIPMAKSRQCPVPVGLSGSIEGNWFPHRLLQAECSSTKRATNEQLVRKSLDSNLLSARKERNCHDAQTLRAVQMKINVIVMLNIVLSSCIA
jgi:hypothetical protein